MGDFFFQTEKADFSTNSLITMRESTNESSRNKATITFNHSLRIVVADFLVNKPHNAWAAWQVVFLFAYWSVNHVKQQNKHALCEFQPKLQFMKRNERLQNVKIRTPLTGLCPNDTRLVEFIYSDCAKSAACHLEVNTPVPPHSVPNVWRAVA